MYASAGVKGLPNGAGKSIGPHLAATRNAAHSSSWCHNKATRVEDAHGKRVCAVHTVAYGGIRWHAGAAQVQHQSIGDGNEKVCTVQYGA